MVLHCQRTLQSIWVAAAQQVTAPGSHHCWSRRHTGDLTSRPASPSSLPKPLFFTPPHGACGVHNAVSDKQHEFHSSIASDHLHNQGVGARCRQ